MSDTKEYKVIKSGVTLGGELQAVGSIVSLTERQATVGLVNKVEPYVAPIEDDEPDSNEEGSEDNDEDSGGVEFTPEELAELEED